MWVPRRIVVTERFHPGTSVERRYHVASGMRDIVRRQRSQALYNKPRAPSPGVVRRSLHAVSHREKALRCRLEEVGSTHP